MRNLFSYITKVLKKIIEAIKNPIMPQTTLLARLNHLIDETKNSQNFVNDIRCTFHTILGVSQVEITIDLIERKSISTKYYIINNAFNKEYVIHFPNTNDAVLTTRYVLNEAEAFERKSIILITQYFQSIGFLIV